MSLIQTSRTLSIAAGLLAAALLLSSAGCGFCLVQPNCGIGCCVDFQCRQPEDCPLQIAPLKMKSGDAQSGHAAQAEVEQTPPNPDGPNQARHGS